MSFGFAITPGVCCFPTGGATGTSPVQVTSEDLTTIAERLQSLIASTDALNQQLIDDPTNVTVNVDSEQLQAIRDLLQQKFDTTNELLRTIEEHGGSVNIAMQQLGDSIRTEVGDTVRDIKNTLGSLPGDLKTYYGEMLIELRQTVTYIDEVEPLLRSQVDAQVESNAHLARIETLLTQRTGTRIKRYWRRNVVIMPQDGAKEFRIPEGAVRILLSSTADRDCQEFCQNAAVDHYTVTSDADNTPMAYRPGMSYIHEGILADGVLDPHESVKVYIPQQPGARFYLFVQFPMETAPADGIQVATPGASGGAAADLGQGEALPDQGTATGDQGDATEGLPDDGGTDGLPT